MFINQEWLDNLGLEMPTTFTEFKEVLTAFKEHIRGQFFRQIRGHIQEQTVIFRIIFVNRGIEQQVRHIARCKSGGLKKC